MGSELVVMDMILKMQNVLTGFIIITGNKPMCDSQDVKDPLQFSSDNVNEITKRQGRLKC